MYLLLTFSGNDGCVYLYDQARGERTLRVWVSTIMHMFELIFLLDGYNNYCISSCMYLSISLG